MRTASAKPAFLFSVPTHQGRYVYVDRTQGRLGHLSRCRPGVLRPAGSQASRRGMDALGARCGRSHLRRLLRMELRSRCRRIRRPLHRHDRHHHHVHRPVLLHLGDVAGDAPHRRGLFLRPVVDGTLGRIHHRSGREHRIRGDTGRGGVFRLDLCAERVQRPVRFRARPALVVGDLLCDLRRAQHHRDRSDDAVLGGDRRDLAGGSRGVLRAGDSRVRCMPS